MKYVRLPAFTLAENNSVPCNWSLTAATRHPQLDRSVADDLVQAFNDEGELLSGDPPYLPAEALG